MTTKTPQPLTSVRVTKVSMSMNPTVYLSSQEVWIKAGASIEIEIEGPVTTELIEGAKDTLGKLYAIAAIEEAKIVLEARQGKVLGKFIKYLKSWLKGGTANDRKKASKKGKKSKKDFKA